MKTLLSTRSITTGSITAGSITAGLITAAFLLISTIGANLALAESKRGDTNIAEISSTYLRLSSALASDDESAANTAFLEIQKHLEKSTDSKMIQIVAKLKGSKETQSIEELRNSFGVLSEGLIPLIETHSDSALKSVKAHCPMALEGKGGYWLQKGEEIRNPYFGSAMLKCGSIVNSDSNS